jgi:hypothetical protein
MNVTEKSDFVLIPAASGGGALVRRVEIVGGRANGNDGSILYLRSGPSVYSTATVPQIARYLEADVAQINRD